MKYILGTLGICYGFISFGQGGIYMSRYEKLVDVTGHNRMSGFHFAPGITYTMAPFRDKEIEYLRKQDTVGKINLEGKSKIGFYAEAGMYHLFRYGRFFRYLDWSIAYKNLKAAQDFTYITSIESTNTNISNGEGTNAFKYNFITANVNLNNIWQIRNYSFIQNSLGLNYDYAIGKKETNNASMVSGSTFAKSIFSLHYKFGFGYKINEKWFIIPALETPILNFIKFEKFKSTLGVFDMRYRPILFTVRIAWLRKPKPNECPPVYGPEGDKARQEKYQMGR